jgi:hypothetical protein
MRLALVVEEDVGRLEIAMEDAALVRVVDSAGDRGEQRGYFSRFVAGSRRL